MIGDLMKKEYTKMHKKNWVIYDPAHKALRCPNCSAIRIITDKYCGRCGTKLRLK